MNIKKTAASVKDHFKRHQTAYAATTTIIATAVVVNHVRVVVPQWNDFLDAHNLRDEFYALED